MLRNGITQLLCAFPRDSRCNLWNVFLQFTLKLRHKVVINLTIDVAIVFKAIFSSFDIYTSQIFWKWHS